MRQVVYSTQLQLDLCTLPSTQCTSQTLKKKNSPPARTASKTAAASYIGTFHFAKQSAHATETGAVVLK